MSQFKINDELIDRIKKLILSEDKSKVIEKLKDVHYADLAEIFELLEISEVVYIIKIFDKQKSADALAELDEDIREGIIENLSVTGGIRDPDGNATDAAIVVKSSAVTIRNNHIYGNKLYLTKK